MNTIETPKQKYVYAFAKSGNTTTISTLASGTDAGVVNQQQGFTASYSMNPTDGGRYIRREEMNAVLNAVSGQACYTQQGGLTRYDATYANNIGGYAQGACVWYQKSDGTETLIKSQVNNNKFNPITNPNFIDNKTDATGAITSDGTVKWKTMIPVLTVVTDASSITQQGVYYFLVQS